MSSSEKAVSGSNNNLWLNVEWNESQTNSAFSIAPVISRWDRYQTQNSASYREWLTLPDGSWGKWDIDRNTTSSGYYVDLDTFATRTYSKGHSAKTITLELEYSGIGTAYDGYFHQIGSGSLSWTITVPALASYTVNYDANGGSGAPSGQVKWYGESLTLSSTVPTRENYIFKGWATSQDGTVQYDASSAYTSNSGATLYAVWELALIPPSATLNAYRVESSSSTVETTDGGFAYATVGWSVNRSKNPSNALSSFLAEVLDENGTSVQRAITGTTSGASGVGIIRFEASTGLRYTLTVTLIDSDGAVTVKKVVVPSVTYPIMIQRIDGQDVVTIENLRVKNAGPAVLYDNPSGTNANVTLSESVAGYDYVRVYYRITRDGITSYGSTDVYDPDGKTVSLIATRSASRSYRYDYGGATLAFSGKGLVFASTGVADSDGSWASDGDVYIIRVIAWNGAEPATGTSGGGGGGGESHSYLLMGSGCTVSLLKDGTTDAGSHTIPAVTQTAAGAMSASDKAKLDGIDSGANLYVHPTYTSHTSGLYKIANDSSGHVTAAASVSKADITALGIPAQDTTYETATQSVDGLMSATDKAKLDGIADNATANVGTITEVQANGTQVAASGVANIPSATTDRYGVTKLSSSTSSTSSSLAATASAVKSAYDLAASKTSNIGTITDVQVDGTTVSTSGTANIPAATNSSAGVMTASDKAKLDDAIVDPGGGTAGQVLTKTSGGTIWKTPSGGGTTVDIPTGSITMFAGSTSPGGYLLCQGQAVSRTTYADLFAVIGTTYGTGDGSTTFNLPNLQGRFALGKSSSYALGSAGGASTVTLTTNQIPAHTHGSKSLTGEASAWGDTGLLGGTSSVSGIISKSGSYSYAPDWANAAGHKLKIDATHEHDSVGGGGAHENMPPYQTVNYIIKT